MRARLELISRIEESTASTLEKYLFPSAKELRGRSLPALILSKETA